MINNARDKDNETIKKEKETGEAKSSKVLCTGCLIQRKG